MDKIANFLKTPEGAVALKAKLQAMPDSEKAKESYKKIWSMACAKVNEYKQKNQLKPEVKQKEAVQTTQKNKAQEKASAKDQPSQAPKKQKSQAAKLVKSENKKANQNNTKHTKQKGNKKPRQFKPPKYAEQDIITMMVCLERHYPKLFNTEKPKPIKVGIFEDMVAEHEDWNTELLQEAIKKYVRAEAYYVACVEDMHRYNLQGDRVDRITEDEEQHAITRLKNLIGRFNLSKKYPQLVGRGNNVTPSPVQSRFYGEHYYAEKRYFEIKSILTECYGKGVGIAYKISNQESLCHVIMQVKRDDEVLFSAEATGKSQVATKKLAGIKLLLHLQNTIEAYPFPYKKVSLTDTEIEHQFFEYYQAKHGNKQTA